MPARQIGLVPTRRVPTPTYYVEALLGEYSPWAYCEEKAPGFKGHWREQAFLDSKDSALDLEIGTGNGYHFSHYSQTYPQRNIVGLEIRFKPLIQAIRRARNLGAKNARMVRYNASFLSHLFESNELNNVLIHHPDPWPKKRQRKRRLIQDHFLQELFELQKNQSLVEFKTDDKDYFEWAVQCFNNSPYKVERLTFDLHNSEYADENYITSFERIFLAKGQPIYYAQLVKDERGPSEI